MEMTGELPWAGEEGTKDEKSMQTEEWINGKPKLSTPSCPETSSSSDTVYSLPSDHFRMTPQRAGQQPQAWSREPTRVQPLTNAPAMRNPRGAEVQRLVI